jgi:lysophospholipase L1-like esterase
MVGGHDLLHSAADPDLLASRLEEGVRALRQDGATVLLANVFDPQSASFLTSVRGRAAVFNANIWTIAREHEAVVLDVWGIRGLQDARMRAPDGVHLGARGHQLLAVTAAHALGVRYAEAAGSESSGLEGGSEAATRLAAWQIPRIGWSGSTAK